MAEDMSPCPCSTSASCLPRVPGGQRVPCCALASGVTGCCCWLAWDEVGGWEFCFSGPRAASEACYFGALGACVFCFPPAAKVYPLCPGVQPQLSSSGRLKDFVPWGERSRQASCSTWWGMCPSESRRPSFLGGPVESQSGEHAPLCLQLPGAQLSQQPAPAFPNSPQVFHCILLTCWGSVFLLLPATCKPALESPFPVDLGLGKLAGPCSLMGIWKSDDFVE